MIKYIISALVVASQAYSTKDASCGYKPKMIFYGEENPKLYQVPARPEMNSVFVAPSTNWRVASTIRDMRARLLAAQKLYDPELPEFIVEAKVNTIMRLMFQDGQDILNFLFNTPDEPCLPDQSASHAHSILISDSDVTINYLSLTGNHPEEIYNNQSYRQENSEYNNTSSHSRTSTPIDYDYYKSNTTEPDYTPYSSNTTRPTSQGSYPDYSDYHQYNSSNLGRDNSEYTKANSYSYSNTKPIYTPYSYNARSSSQAYYHQYNSTNLGRDNSSYGQNHHSSPEATKTVDYVSSRKNYTSNYDSDDDEISITDGSDDEYHPSKDDYDYSDDWF